jgi:hypothetical protein
MRDEDAVSQSHSKDPFSLFRLHFTIIDDDIHARHKKPPAMPKVRYPNFETVWDFDIRISGFIDWPSISPKPAFNCCSLC